jgi:hypothetical protein
MLYQPPKWSYVEIFLFCVGVMAGRIGQKDGVVTLAV